MKPATVPWGGDHSHTRSSGTARSRSGLAAILVVLTGCQTRPPSRTTPPVSLHPCCSVIVAAQGFFIPDLLIGTTRDGPPVEDRWSESRRYLGQVIAASPWPPAASGSLDVDEVELLADPFDRAGEVYVGFVASS